MTIALPRGHRLVSGTLVGSNGVRHNVRSLSAKGVLLNSERRAINVGRGTYRLRIRTVRKNGRGATTRRFTVNVT